MKKPSRRTVHGVELVDDYAWLRDAGYPEVTDKKILAYLAAENRYCDAILEPHRQMLDAMFEELKGRVKDDDASVPVMDGAHLYWWEFEKGAQYRRWYRKPAQNRNAEVTCFLDEEERAAGHNYFRVRSFEVSPDGTLLAWSEDTDGSERYVIRVKNIETGEVIGTETGGTYGTMVWSADGKHLLYIELNENLRPFRVLAHALNAHQEDVILYEENEPSFFVGIGKTRSKKYIFISSGDHVTSEVQFLKSDAVLDPLKMIEPRIANRQYSVDHADGEFYIRTNDTHRNFRLVHANPEHCGAENWQEVVAGSDDVYLTGVDCFQDFMVLSERRGGLEQIHILDYNLEGHWIEFPEEAYSAGLGQNPEFATASIRLSYNSMVTPPSVLSYQISDRHMDTLKVDEIPSGHNVSDYVVRRLMAPAIDGTEIPVSVLQRRELVLDGKAPLFLYGYGSYGLGMDPGFRSTRFSLVDRGFAFAIAHIRGGDEMGYHWYEDGKLQNKKNTFTDFIAVAEMLIGEGYTTAGNIAIHGGSAGGMLVGAVMNMRPDLFRTVIADVPFVDVMNTMLDDSLPLTPIEFPEWGNPAADKAAFDYILSYSPYENLAAKDYPNVFATAGISDPRVTYWEPAKFVARLREVKTDDNLVVLKTNMAAGHGGASGRFDQLKEVAEHYVFVLKTFDMLN